MKKIIPLSLFFISAVCLILTSCSSNSNQFESNGDEKLVVIVSVAPYKTMVEQIAGNTVSVRTAVPSDLDPHNWEPKYKDMGRFKKAKIWFTIGEHFEPKLSKKLKDTNSQLLILNLAEHVALLSNPSLPTTPSSPNEASDTHEGCLTDTHFWLDPILDIQQAKFIAANLSELNPQYSNLYNANLQKLINSLEILNKNVAKAIEPYRGKMILTAHGAYTYYCKQYGLEQIVLEPSGGKEARTQDLSKAVEFAKTHKKDIVAVFIQPQHTNKSTVALAKALDLPEAEVNPYEADYIKTIKHITNVISHKYGKEAFAL